MPRKYFGTDGIRGRAGEPPLDRVTIRALGRAAGRVLGPRGGIALLAADTRASGPSIVSELVAGLVEEGVACRYAGVLPTPGLAHATRGEEIGFGVMVTASHNPAADNGIKFFSHEGYKLPDETEEDIERHLESFSESPSAAGANPAPPGYPVAGKEYLDWLRSGWEGQGLRGKTIAVDCANGAACDFAPALFESLGARVVRLACSPDGGNINSSCGSLHPEVVREAVRSSGAFLGLTFDGDADRCLAVTPSGKILDGDYTLYHEAMRRKAGGTGTPGGVVGTVMSNLWLEKELALAGISFTRAQVGDRYVLEKMREAGSLLGGEPSGHVIFLDRSTTGDGLLSALSLARAAVERGGAEALAEGITPYPQATRNMKVGRRVDIESDPGASSFVESEKARLAEKGRVVVRFSGTEPLLRVMVEAESEKLVEESLDRLCSSLGDHLGRIG